MTTLISTCTLPRNAESPKVVTSASERLAKFIYNRSISVRSASQLIETEKILLLKMLNIATAKSPFFAWTLHKVGKSNATSELEQVFLDWQNTINTTRPIFSLHKNCCEEMLAVLRDKTFHVTAGCAFTFATEEDPKVIDHEGHTCTTDPWLFAFTSNCDEDFAKAKALRPYPQNIFKIRYTSRQLAKSIGWDIELATATKNEGVVNYLNYLSKLSVKQKVVPMAGVEVHQCMAEALEGTVEQKILDCCNSQNYGLALWLTNQASTFDLRSDLLKAALRTAYAANQTELRFALEAKGVKIIVYPQLFKI